MVGLRRLEGRPCTAYLVCAGFGIKAKREAGLTFASIDLFAFHVLGPTLRFPSLAARLSGLRVPFVRLELLR